MRMAKHVSDIKMLSNQSSKISQTLLTDLSLALRMPHVLILYVPSFLHMQIAHMNSGHHSSLLLLVTSLFLPDWVEFTDVGISEWTCGGGGQVVTTWSQSRPAG